MPDKVNISKLEKEFSDIKSAKRLIIIKKSGEMLDLAKYFAVVKVLKYRHRGSAEAIFLFEDIYARCNLLQYTYE